MSAIEDAMKMPEDLEKLARTFKEWPLQVESYMGYTRQQWQAARRELGLDKSLDDATPAEWDAASRAVRAGEIEPDEEECYKLAEDRMIGKKSKYHKRVKGIDIDVYDVLQAFGVTNPADAHAIKKMLCPGQRGVKDAIQDRREAIQSLERAIELEQE